ncbi:Tubulin-like protein [Planctomycetes bacterium CA13]|uniref:Tubulin-like protein n=1 Tax=Novipirellula herctigrandis TaxID=2527986 RepID=A0A5C5ZBH7_9BACT|nr:Tubulin-like protein [Planctomycetes bacterium CA13]
MTATNTRKICAGYEPIPGYVLEKLVGRGGFGEVWRADAPGGIKKAVKFVFGAHDQQRAARELKSLERIKGVSHPFLLTLERFGIVDDQLVIVTELADRSLEEVFRDHRERGSCGIPRDKLLSHLMDAADALDYLHGSYQLQHLDIKPGNLLVVGGHVKVADFGLLKDLRDDQCSVVGGLTPVYAPPEVFDGRPSLHSDQYSLAVMYQELLTGTRPFSGRTIAQLATQHVHNAPDLEPLPPSDRPAAARALEKNPERRFSDCRSFVEALMNPRGRVSDPIGCNTELDNDDTDPEFAGEANARQIEDLPSLGDGRIQRDGRAVSKVLLVALGGVGADVLHDIRSRIGSLHSACPIQLHSILIDTDEASIRGARIGNGCDALPSCEVVHIPLRTAADYRDSMSTNRLRTISRRWIYNVPRSLSTEGMRPLGRLALVDHGQKVTDSLRRAIEQLGRGESETIPKVFVVGSLCGGTGSGIYLDVVHLLRHLLDTNGLEQSKVFSMLAMKGMVHDPALSLAHHDAHSTLIEMNHYLQPGNGYPGDEGAGWPSVPAARTPLKDAYLVASNEFDPDAPSPVQVIGDYVWTDSTGADSLLEKARSIDVEASSSQVFTPQVRSVGIVPLGVFRRPEEEILTPATVRHLLLRWLGHPGEAKLNAPLLHKRLARRCFFDGDLVSGIISSAFGSANTHRHAEIERRLAEMSASLTEHSDDHVLGMEQVAAMVTQWANEVMHLPQVTRFVDDLTQQVTRELSARFTHNSTDVTTAIETLGLFLKEIGAESARLRSQAETLGGSEDANCDERKCSCQSDESMQQVFIASRLVTHTIYRLAAEQVERFARNVNGMVSRLGDLATSFAVAISVLAEQRDATDNPWDEMPAQVAAKFEHTVSELHKACVSSIIVRSLGKNAMPIDPTALEQRLADTASPLVGSALAVCCAGSISQSHSFDQATQSLGDVTAVLPTQHGGGDEGTSTMAISSESKSFDVDAGGKRDDQPITSMATALQMARPSLLDYGGVQRLILSVGTHSEQVRLEAELRQFHNGALTVTVIPGTTAKLVHEAQQIQLCDVIARLATLNAGNAQVSTRLLTRSDIDWRKANARPSAVATK